MNAPNTRDNLSKYGELDVRDSLSNYDISNTSNTFILE